MNRVLGWREWVALPNIGVDAVRAKVDTGARTSALNARDIKPFERDGCRWVRFTLRVDRRRSHDIVCTAAVTDVREVKDSGGRAEERYIIETDVRIGDRLETWPIEISLTNRTEMRFAMLLGRTAIRRRFLVHPGRSFLAGRLLSVRDQMRVAAP